MSWKLMTAGDLEGFKSSCADIFFLFSATGWMTKEWQMSRIMKCASLSFHFSKRKRSLPPSAVGNTWHHWQKTIRRLYQSASYRQHITKEKGNLSYLNSLRCISSMNWEREQLSRYWKYGLKRKTSSFNIYGPHLFHNITPLNFIRVLLQKCNYYLVVLSENIQPVFTDLFKQHQLSVWIGSYSMSEMHGGLSQ